MAELDTYELLLEAGNRAENLSRGYDETAEDYFASMGINDDEVLHKYVDVHTKEILKVTILLGERLVDIRDLMGTAMLFGISVGYQLALLREVEQ